MTPTYITKEANHFIKCRILDKYMSGHSGFIAGGCFKNIFNGQKIKDIDIFFEKEEDFDQLFERWIERNFIKTQSAPLNKDR